MNATNPLSLAKLHETDVRRAFDAMTIQLNCIRQLMVGRKVRHLHTHRKYTISSVAVAPGGSVALSGTRRQGGKEYLIGTLHHIEVLS